MLIVKNIPEKPDGRKKGLRMQIRDVEIDSDGNLVSLFVEYSTGKGRGMGVISCANRNRIRLYEGDDV